MTDDLPVGPGGPQEETIERTEKKAVEPELWKVYLLNDDYTTMDFVVDVLEGIFRMSPAEAHGTMMHIHRNGKGLAGVYPHEIAETKAAAAIDAARSAGFPLQATLERE